MKAFFTNPRIPWATVALAAVLVALYPLHWKWVPAGTMDPYLGRMAQSVGSVFGHASPAHLLTNIGGLLILGTVVELAWSRIAVWALVVGVGSIQGLLADADGTWNQLASAQGASGGIMALGCAGFVAAVLRLARNTRRFDEDSVESLAFALVGAGGIIAVVCALSAHFEMTNPEVMARNNVMASSHFNGLLLGAALALVCNIPQAVGTVRTVRQNLHS